VASWLGEEERKKKKRGRGRRCSAGGGEKQRGKGEKGERVQASCGSAAQDPFGDLCPCGTSPMG
jgi:hypothetical protein